MPFVSKLVSVTQNRYGSEISKNMRICYKFPICLC